ncbi:MAG: LPS export ABC transporter periplasmic protein LptC [Crocinitomicaceae bacterium]|nr:LPS export ABC transporter periplasmic protein LptC [Crocinitomicaceae bacterium]
MKLFSSTHTLQAIPVILFMTGILFSCVNDLDTIQKVTYDPNAPDEITRNLEVFYTDSGFAQVRIFAHLAETYSKPKHVTQLKEGLKVDFFSQNGEVVSTLTALYGEIDFDTGLIVVRDSVVLYNLAKKQYLETEELFYNQKDSTIFTEKNVIIKTDGKGVTGRGRGIKTTQSFNKYVITNPVGKLNISED